MCVTVESLWYIPEMNITLYVNFIYMKNQRKDLRDFFFFYSH